MMFFRSIYPQYVLETFAIAGLFFVAVLPMMKRREPRKVVAVLLALNVLRFGGVAGALAALRGSGSPAFLLQVAAGDGITAMLAVVALVLTVRASDKAPLAIAAMNVLGLSGILVSETWLEYLEQSGSVARGAFIHGPTIGAAFYTAVHILVFYFLSRGGVAAKSASPILGARIAHADFSVRTSRLAARR
jgi:hypothetical protein